MSDSDRAPLPSEQFVFEGLPRLDEATLHRRREHFFLVLAGLFLGTLAMLNILAVTHFIDLSFTVFGVTVPMPLAVGVLPYPLTFLCTDLISELYGKERASAVVWVGLLLNGWVAFILWLGGALPAASHSGLFFDVRRLAFAAIGASMAAYLAAQLVDVHLFHFWKRLTHGRHLWLRNNGSTLVSQLVDTVAVILITHAVGGLPIDANEPVIDQLTTYIAAGYVFKLVSALADTGPFYLGVHLATRYLRLAPGEGRLPETSVEA